MHPAVRVFLAFEAATFVLAALVHSGVLLTGYERHAARVAETVIALLLLAGIALGWMRPAWARGAALAACIFATQLDISSSCSQWGKLSVGWPALR